MAIWDDLGKGNIEDRRGMGGVAGGVGIAGLALVAGLTLLQGGSLGDVVGNVAQVAIQQGFSTGSTEDPSAFAGEDEYERFASAVLGSADEYWTEALPAAYDVAYEPPTLVLFRGSTQSGCGGADSRIGPHYCPADGTLYLDETFFEELTTQLGARGGDVAEAYVIAHEVGHHVQTLTGASQRVERDGSNEASIALELQADCYAGLWAWSLRDRNVFAPGEIEEAIDAAAAVGDDRIQQTSGGRIRPETWTHGSSADRVKWFNTGFESGSVAACDTFSQ